MHKFDIGECAGSENEQNHIWLSDQISCFGGGCCFGGGLYKSSCVKFQGKAGISYGL